jgi:hypothetical protein
VPKLHPDELVWLAPRLRLYLRRPDPTWPEVVDAADWLRHDLDVSKPLWARLVHHVESYRRRGLLERKNRTLVTPSKKDMETTSS